MNQQAIEKRQFESAGFQIVHTGSSFTAWSKSIDAERYVLITDSDGLDHCLRAVSVGEEADYWLIGLYNDGLPVGDPVEDFTISGAIAKAEKIVLSAADPKRDK